MGFLLYQRSFKNYDALHERCCFQTYPVNGWNSLVDSSVVHIPATTAAAVALKRSGLCSVSDMVSGFISVSLCKKTSFPMLLESLEMQPVSIASAVKIATFKNECHCIFVNERAPNVEVIDHGKARLRLRLGIDVPAAEHVRPAESLYRGSAGRRGSEIGASATARSDKEKTGLDFRSLGEKCGSPFRSLCCISKLELE